ncbi:coiled-coil domain-containing protein 66 isoform X2 [Syngnathoides biaculeatus]|uniref:coiled-coil domain-containing protein 66 isoform X2 n=1 Tax=Syngnathoides biaculeatus TaxID=300417 RepID=UPI002ADE8AD2|nr:coiled-coil domain-containing protein 66 isoform X2 [Syngnathoides biaculeatus]
MEEERKKKHFRYKRKGTFKTPPPLPLRERGCSGMSKGQATVFGTLGLTTSLTEAVDSVTSSSADARGDGLLFEIQNGKPKLIVLNHTVERNLVTNSLRPRPACSGQLFCAKDVRAQRRAGQRPAAPRGPKTQAADNGASFGSGGAGDRTRGGQTASKTRVAVVSKAAPKKSERQKSRSTSDDGAAVPSERWAAMSDQKSGPTGSTDPPEDQGPRAVTTLRICHGFQTASQDRPVTEEHGASSQHVHHTLEEKEGQGGGGELDEDRAGPDQTATNGNSPQKDDRCRSQGGVLGWLERRTVDDKASVEAKKAQWRQQLDEQVALKQQQRCSTSVKLQAEQEPGSECSVHPAGRRKEQPAAIRSSLRLGAVTPMEETLASQRREEQKRLWLEDLDRQRQETSQRRMREKMLLSQNEDHELWAAHFDSLQRKHPAGGTQAPPTAPSSDRKASPGSSLTWDPFGRCEVQVGVDPAKSSYHRSMTALLDPVQMEERERRRLKQLEQQRDIRAQVEEQRRHKLREEARRRAEDREEERRVAQERDALLGRYRQEQREQRKEPEVSDDTAGHNPTRRVHSAARIKSVVGANEVAECTKEQPEKNHDDGGVKESVGACVSSPAATATEKKDTAVQTDAPPPPVRAEPPQTPPNCRNRAGKENVQKGRVGAGAVGGDSYEAFARTEEKRRPEWNTRRPSRRFVPASERYPAPLQRSRQESRLKRQEEILGLQDRNCPPVNRQRPGTRRETRIVASRPRSDNAESTGNGASANTERGRSPLIPQPSLQFIPYIRTDDVVHLDPAETPTPHTHTALSCAPPPDISPADVVTLRSTQRQQEILRGLAQLRQGLLEKQRELVSDLRGHDDKRPPPTKC